MQVRFEETFGKAGKIDMVEIHGREGFTSVSGARSETPLETFPPEDVLLYGTPDPSVPIYKPGIDDETVPVTLTLPFRMFAQMLPWLLPS